VGAPQRMNDVSAAIRCKVGEESVVFPIERLGVCRIGRGSENSIVLPDGLASREHAMIRRNASGFCILTDLGSRNGTRLNGRPITTPTQLKDGDVVQIGEHKMAFAQDEMPLEISPAAAGAAATQFVLSQSLITTLVIDIRGYTILSQILGEERISALMADIFQAAGEVLYRKRSWSQKFIGDAIMAVWVHVDDRVSGAELLNIFDVISEFEEIFRPLQRKFDLLNPLRFGVGINTGHASIGNIGSASSADFTALGDSVNKAFRLETATKETGHDILMGESVVEFLFPPLPPEKRPDSMHVDLKGYEGPELAYPLKFAELGAFSDQLAKNEARG
jgi:adenylate cyclase